LYSYTTGISREKRYFDFVKLGKTKRLNIHFLDFGNVEWAPFWSINFRNNFSIHFTKDGYKITFEYDEDGYVKNKKVEMIWNLISIKKIMKYDYISLFFIFSTKPYTIEIRVGIMYLTSKISTKDFTQRRIPRAPRHQPSLLVLLHTSSNDIS